MGLGFVVIEVALLIESGSLGDHNHDRGESVSITALLTPV